MNRLIISIVGVASIAAVVGPQVLAALGKTPPEGIHDIATACISGLIGIATNEVARAVDKAKEKQDEPI